jgi:hypothetical protein
MRTMTRTFHGWGKHNHTPIAIIPGAADRPIDGHSVRMAQLPFNMSGPQYKGMDPSNPATFVRPWNPQPGMIAFLNFDGAGMQMHTPIQVQRGPQARPRKLNVGF